MKKNGLETRYPIFVRDTVHPERRTISGIIDTNRKELKVYQIPQEDPVISTTRE
jgi:hypothetical protein